MTRTKLSLALALALGATTARAETRDGNGHLDCVGCTEQQAKPERRRAPRPTVTPISQVAASAEPSDEDPSPVVYVQPEPTPPVQQAIKLDACHVMGQQTMNGQTQQMGIVDICAPAAPPASQKRKSTGLSSGEKIAAVVVPVGAVVVAGIVVGAILLDAHVRRPPLTEIDIANANSATAGAGAVASALQVAQGTAPRLGGWIGRNGGGLMLSGSF